MPQQCHLRVVLNERSPLKYTVLEFLNNQEGPGTEQD
jgi:hypothetical protein